MTVHDPYAVEPRKALTDQQRLKLFIREGGTCCICRFQIIGHKEAWDEHIKPLWRDGTNVMSNRGVAHRRCALQKSAKEAEERAKGRRVAQKHFGAKRSKRPMAGSRASKWKKHLDGSVSER